MAHRRQEIEAFVRHLVAQVEAAKAAGIFAPQAIADHFNANGVTTRKGRRWTGTTVAKFLGSSGVKRYRSGGTAGRMVKPKGNPDEPCNALDKAQLLRISEVTIAYYDRAAEAYRDGTWDHDVSQNHEALLEAIEGEPPYAILDLGCGSGRDLRYFRSLGHDATGLDGSMELVTMARRYSGCDVLHQDFLAMNLPVNPLRRHFRKCVVVPRAEPGVAPGVSGTRRIPEAPGHPVLLEPERERRRRLQRRPLQLLLRSYHLARFRHCCRVHGGKALLPPSRTPALQTAVARYGLAQRLSMLHFQTRCRQGPEILGMSRYLLKL